MLKLVSQVFTTSKLAYSKVPSTHRRTRLLAKNYREAVMCQYRDACGSGQRKPPGMTADNDPVRPKC